MLKLYFKFNSIRYYQWQKYCSLSNVSSLSHLKTRGELKEHSSIDKVNIHRIRVQLLCCISSVTKLVRFEKK